MATNEASVEDHAGTTGGFSAVVDASVLQSAVAKVRVLVDEARIHLNPTGWRVTAIDPATVGMVDLSVDAEAFDAYEAAAETIGVDLERLGSVLGTVDDDERVHLDLDHTTRELRVRVGGLDYTLALVDPGAIRKEPDLPDALDLDARAVVDAAALERATRAADLVSDHVTLASSPDPDPGSVVVSAEGDTDDVTLELDDEDLVDADVTGAGTSLYSLSYLTAMTGAIPGETAVTTEFGEDLPLRLSSTPAEGVDLTYVLAPRIARGN